MTQVQNIIRETAAKYGFTTTDTSYSKFPTINSEEMNFTILEHTDPDADWSSRKVKVNLEISASVRKMGGSPTVEELLKTADEIHRGAELLRELQGMELSYIAEF